MYAANTSSWQAGTRHPRSRLSEPRPRSWWAEKRPLRQEGGPTLVPVQRSRERGPAAGPEAPLHGTTIPPFGMKGPGPTSTSTVATCCVGPQRMVPTPDPCTQILREEGGPLGLRDSGRRQVRSCSEVCTRVKGQRRDFEVVENLAKRESKEYCAWFRRDARPKPFRNIVMAPPLRTAVLKRVSMLRAMGLRPRNAGPTCGSSSTVVGIATRARCFRGGPGWSTALKHSRNVVSS